MTLKISDLILAESMTELDACQSRQVRGGRREQINIKQFGYVDTGGLIVQTIGAEIDVIMLTSTP